MPKFTNHILASVLPVVPKNQLSYFVGRAVQIPLPGPLARLSVQAFAKAFHIDMDEAEFPIEHYKTIGELFTRRLKPGVRPLADGIIHPVDGRLTQVGRIADGILVQCKGRSYELAELLKDEGLARRLDGGLYVTYYLCPTDYHRVHSPLAGKLTSCRHLPGQLWPVNPWSVENVRDLFAINERVVMEIQQEKGLLIEVMVGATNVGKIAMSFDPDVVTNSWRREDAIRVKRYDPPLPVAKGQELGVFNMGSSVILLFDKEIARQFGRLPFSGSVRLGEPLN